MKISIILVFIPAVNLIYIATQRVKEKIRIQAYFCMKEVIYLRSRSIEHMVYQMTCFMGTMLTTKYLAQNGAAIDSPFAKPLRQVHLYFNSVNDVMSTSATTNFSNQTKNSAECSNKIKVLSRNTRTNYKFSLSPCYSPASVAAKLKTNHEHRKALPVDRSMILLAEGCYEFF